MKKILINNDSYMTVTYYTSFIWVNISLLILLKGKLEFKGIRLDGLELYFFISIFILIILNSLKDVLNYLIMKYPELTYDKILLIFMKSQLFKVFVFGNIIQILLKINFYIFIIMQLLTIISQYKLLKELEEKY